MEADSDAVFELQARIGSLIILPQLDMLDSFARTAHQLSMVKYTIVVDARNSIAELCRLYTINISNGGPIDNDDFQDWTAHAGQA